MGLSLTSPYIEAKTTTHVLDEPPYPSTSNPRKTMRMRTFSPAGEKLVGRSKFILYVYSEHATLALKEILNLPQIIPIDAVEETDLDKNKSCFWITVATTREDALQLEYVKPVWLISVEPWDFRLA